MRGLNNLASDIYCDLQIRGENLVGCHPLFYEGYSRA